MRSSPRADTTTVVIMVISSRAVQAPEQCSDHRCVQSTIPDTKNRDVERRTPTPTPKGTMPTHSTIRAVRVAIGADHAGFLLKEH